MSDTPLPAVISRSFDVKGIVLDDIFIPLETLHELSESDRWDSDFGNAFLLERDQRIVLEKYGWAKSTARGHCYGTEQLTALIAGIEGS